MRARRVLQVRPAVQFYSMRWSLCRLEITVHITVKSGHQAVLHDFAGLSCSSFACSVSLNWDGLEND